MPLAMRGYCPNSVLTCKILAPEGVTSSWHTAAQDFSADGLAAMVHARRSKARVMVATMLAVVAPLIFQGGPCFSRVQV